MQVFFSKSYVSFKKLQAFVGRPAIWGLATNGTKGVTKVLEVLRDELDLTMALSGK